MNSTINGANPASDTGSGKAGATPPSRRGVWIVLGPIWAVWVILIFVLTMLIFLIPFLLFC